MKTDLSRNLRLLCSFEKSVSEVCRAININRQQFNKYLSGATKPSSHNLHRICEHFQVQLADLYLSYDEFATRIQFRTVNKPSLQRGLPQGIFDRAFPGDARALRRYVGYYLSSGHSFSWPGYILTALVCIYEHDGMFLSKSIERVKDPNDGNRYLSKYDGFVSFLGERIYVMEFQSLAEDALVETVLFPTGRSQLTTLRGVTFGISSKNHNPYVSRVIWKYLGRSIDPRTALNTIGLTPIGSLSLDPKITNYLGREPFPNEQLHDGKG